MWRYLTYRKRKELVRAYKSIPYGCSFWPRSDVPHRYPTLLYMDLSDWGTPTAAYTSSACNVSEYFQPQNLIIDITLFGVWTGVPSIYNATGCSGQCIDGVIGTDANATASEATSKFTATATAVPSSSTTSNFGGNSATYFNAAVLVGPKSLLWVVSSTLFAIWLSTMALGA
ncbi:hypothetical protein BT96DRAFT_947438 [Gymnopus androsaceus JB14]|uniref:Uncharacterized protein n=1 Tax=Gymnopus androsaceus JB14 TaxID=1447944 RepID=A0A6A4GSB4_9AGAR|nr:hypothetical protein BT96DRAFT_947438 [Gymnopus androsaceus JB14]